MSETSNANHADDHAGSLLAAGGDPGGAIRSKEDFSFFMLQLEEEVRTKGMYFDFVMAVGHKILGCA